MRHITSPAAIVLAASSFVYTPYVTAQVDFIPASNETVWRNASTTHLAVAATQGRSMDAEVADMNGDGIMDIIVATEFATNFVMHGTKRGIFEYPTGLFPGARIADSEDIAIADFNNDGKLDLAFACEDDMIPELYLQNHEGTFEDASDRLSAQTVGNAILAIDIDNDGDMDLILADAGQPTMPQAPSSGAPNVLMINDGSGNFERDDTGILPKTDGATQDIEAGDIDNDGDLDLIIGNENGNELWMNTNGKFIDMTETHLPSTDAPIETRELDLADIDNDGDLDLYVANVGWRGLDARNVLYVNNGEGVFQNVSKQQIPTSLEWTLDVDFADLDADGDVDIVLAQHDQGGQAKPLRVLINDGSGNFEDQTDEWVPEMALIHAIDVEVGDFDNDGTLDLYVANHVSADRLLLSSKQ